MKLLKAIERFLFGLFFLFFLGLSLFLVFSSNLFVWGPKIFVVESGSMARAIPAGSLVVVFPSEEYKMGDVVSFKRPDVKDIRARGAVITHRIIDVIERGEEKTFVTKGDNNQFPDTAQISKNQIIGKVCLAIPLLGRILAFAKTPLGLVLLIVVPGMIIIYQEVEKIKNEIINLRKKRLEERKRATKKKEKNDLFKLLFLVFGLGSIVLGVSLGKFSDLVVVKAISFSSGYWVKPESEILLSEIIFNTAEFDIPYRGEGDNLDFVELWYSYNEGNWRLFGSDHPNSLGSFDFNSPEGDGVYYFLTVAVDQYGNVEDRNGDARDDNSDQSALWDAYNSLDDPLVVQVDTEAPTMNLSLATDSFFQAGESLIDGSFENGMSHWVGGGDGDHHIETRDDGRGNAYLLGFRDGENPAGGNDYLFYDFILPENLSSSLVFDWRVVSEDVVDYDWFSVSVRDWSNNLLDLVLKTGSGNLVDTSGWLDGSGWRSAIYPLINFAGRPIRVWFEVINSQDNNNRTWAYLDNVMITTTDIRTTDQKDLDFEIHDGSGSGEFENHYQVDEEVPESYQGDSLALDPGDHHLVYSAEDSAGNIAQDRSLDLVVVASPSAIAINAFSAAPKNRNEWVELFNNDDIAIDLAGWKICDDSVFDNNVNNRCVVLSQTNSETGTTIINNDGRLKFSANFLLNNDGDTVVLFDQEDNLIDQYQYPNFNGKHDLIWRRNPDGLGQWQLLEPGIELTVISRYDQAGKILMTIDNLPEDYGQGDLIEYEITYSVANQEQGIAGRILPETVKNYRTSWEFYLGTCSSGVCVPHLVDNRQIMITLSQGEAVIAQENFSI